MSLPEVGYHKLIVYKKSKELVIYLYKLTAKFPREEQYVLLPQMRRAGISVLANIVEGYSKSSRKEFARFLDISIGSASELEIFLDLSKDLGYMNKDNKISELLIEVKKMLYSFRKSLKGGVGTR